MFFDQKVTCSQVRQLPLKSLAHLGDAVFELYEREKIVFDPLSTRKMHKQVVERVNAHQQAELLDLLSDGLTAEEADLVRRARNLKPAARKSVDQSTYRRATAFEALIGYLYLTDFKRLSELLSITSRA